MLTTIHGLIVFDIMGKPPRFGKNGPGNPEKMFLPHVIEYLNNDLSKAASG